MPILSELSQRSFYFNNIYYQIGAGNTSDAEFLMNNSLYPVSEGAAYFRFPTNNYISLPQVLEQTGYGTYAFHAYNPSFWNRSVMYQSLGFDKFVSNMDYVQDKKIGWGLADESFYVQSLDMIDTGGPFYAFMISLSSHHPFNFFDNYEFDVGKYEDTVFGNYIKAANYDDYALGILFDELKKRDLYDNSVIVIYGDHFGLNRDQTIDALEFLDRENNDFEWAKLQKVPLIIHCPGMQEGKTVDITGGQIDILPTIANLIDIEIPYALGKDLLNSDEGYAVLRNGSVFTDRYIYLSSSGEVYDINSGEPVDNPEFRAEIDKLNSELLISDLIIEKNAIK
jgi:lipoteichoic acid synthase